MWLSSTGGAQEMNGRSCRSATPKPWKPSRSARTAPSTTARSRSVGDVTRPVIGSGRWVMGVMARNFMRLPLVAAVQPGKVVKSGQHSSIWRNELEKGGGTVTAWHPLDNPVRSSLVGPHARFAERRGHVLRYPADVSPFFAMPDEPDAADWADAAALAGPGGLLPLAASQASQPAAWPLEMRGEGVQLTGDDVA